MTTGRAVEVYSATSYAERPTAVCWKGARLAVREVSSRWRMPAGPGFDVIVTDGQRLRLQYSEAGDIWTVQEID